MKLLKKLYKISSPSNKESAMQKFVISLLKGAGISYTKDEKGNIYAIKGESDTYPCVVCHIDEVHKDRKIGYKVIETDGVIYGINTNTMSFEGIGADDKNGIWVCIRALNDFDVIKCAFFVAEEVGCQGSRVADMSFFENCRFVLQCDRKGKSDFITTASCTELCTDKFLNDANVGLFGYSKASGMMTDVMQLKERGLKVSACNISCGYYNPHTNNEMTRFSDLLNCYNLVSHIIKTCTCVYPHEYKKPVYNYQKYDNYYYKGGKHGGYRGYSSPDPIINRLKDLYISAWERDGKYFVWDSENKKSKLASEEDLQYAKNIGKYEMLLDYYDEVRFDKDGNPLVRLDGDTGGYYAPDEDVLNEIFGFDEELQMSEYDEMIQKMDYYSNLDPIAFSLDEFFKSYSTVFPHLKREHYQMAYDDLVSCVY